MGTTNEASYREFVAARWRPLLRTSYLLTGDAGRAEDLLQTALARLWIHWSRIAEDNPEAYVRKILANTSASWWRRRWHGEVPTDVLPDRASVDDFTATTGLRDELRASLAILTPRQRAVVVLRYADDLSEQQVADVLGISAGTVKTLASRGLARLRDAASTPSEVTL